MSRRARRSLAGLAADVEPHRGTAVVELLDYPNWRQCEEKRGHATLFAIFVVSNEPRPLHSHPATLAGSYSCRCRPSHALRRPDTCPHCHCRRTTFPDTSCTTANSPALYRPAPG